MHDVATVTLCFVRLLGLLVHSSLQSDGEHTVNFAVGRERHQSLPSKFSML